MLIVFILANSADSDVHFIWIFTVCHSICLPVPGLAQNEKG